MHALDIYVESGRYAAKFVSHGQLERRYKVGEPTLLARFTMGQYHSLVKKGPSNSSVSEYNP